MGSMRINRFAFNALLAVCLISLTRCTSTSGTETGWQKKNKELIAKYNLKERELSGLPKTTIVSNLEPAKVTSLDKLDSISLVPGCTCQTFLGKRYHDQCAATGTQCKNSGRSTCRPTGLYLCLKAPSTN